MEYADLTEKSLIEKSQNGNTESFEELMGRTQDYLYGWIFEKTRDKLDTEELLQITFIKCWKNIKKFKGDAKFQTWACAISRNLFIDKWRKAQKNKEHSIEEVRNAYSYQRCSHDSGYENLVSQDVTASLEKILNDLPEKHKEVLVSSAIEQLSYKEMSLKYKCSIGTIMSRLYYARKKAQQLIETRKGFTSNECSQ